MAQLCSVPGSASEAEGGHGPYPCLCLWRGFVQMTMVVPCRLMMRQRSHMGLTDGRTFMSTVPVGDPTAVQVVRAQLHVHLVARKDADVVLSHLSGDGGEHVVSGVELHPEHRAWERFDDLAFDLDLLFLFGHVLSSYRGSRARQSRSRRAVIVAERPRLLSGF